MPNYDYVCQDCGHRFEVFQSMNDPKLEDCPKDSCSGKVKRLLGTGAGLIFKGAGFYQTDYRSASYQSGAKQDSSPSPASPEGGSCGSSCACAPAPSTSASPAAN